MRTPSGDEDSLAGPLVNTVAHDAKSPVELLAERRVQVELLRVDGVVLELAAKLLVQERAQLRRVRRLVDVPRGAPRAAVGGRRRLGHDVDRVGHVHVQARRAFAALRLERGQRVVHLWACKDRKREKSVHL